MQCALDALAAEPLLCCSGACGRAPTLLAEASGSAPAAPGLLFRRRAAQRLPAAVWRAPRCVLVLLLALPSVECEYFPDVNVQSTWDPPVFQPWDALRAHHAFVTVAWMPAWNPWATLRKYELEARRPAGYPLHFANLEGIQHRELDNENPDWPGEEHWTDWGLVYTGLARAYTLRIPQNTGHTAQLRVRACGQTAAEGCSPWSEPQIAHTVLSAAVDKINFYIRGVGKNSMDYTEIVVNEKTIYRRRDQTGLVLAIFSRYDFSLQWLQVYDTHRHRSEALQMSKDIRKFNQSNFVVVASTIAWEWHATSALAKVMEYCGAYHFGQWVHIFAEQAHYSSPKSDLQQTATQAEFCHPYAFIGIPGIGVGMGWESLMYNTGQYVPTVGVPKAIIRGIGYYDYVSRIYRLQDVLMAKADFYTKNIPPPFETMHNPLPASKVTQSLTNLMAPRVYNSYVGTLQMHFTALVEANLTVPPFNYAFLIITVAGVKRVDPRPRKYWQTELERVWSGKSARYWPDNAGSDRGKILSPGVELEDRDCFTYLYYGYAEATPEGCGQDFRCLDNGLINDYSSLLAMRRAGFVFDWNNLFTFKPDKSRYDLTGRVPLTSYWGMNLPGEGSFFITLIGTGTVHIDFGNCWLYSLGYVELLHNGKRIARAPQLTPSVNVTLRFTHLDTITIRESEAVIVLNSIRIVCWGCCPTTDQGGILATSCDVGVTPTMCRGTTQTMMTNTSQRLVSKNPYPFRVVPEVMDPRPQSSHT